METATKAKAGGLVAGIVAVTGLYTAVHGTHTESKAISRNDTPVVINRPHDANGSPLPVSIITPGPGGGPPIVIVGRGAPTRCSVRHKGADTLPDRACTPGVADPRLKVADLCPHLGASVVRAVSQSEKNSVREDYGDHSPGEIDHLISLELGGSNDQGNLWPQDGKIPNRKDAIENRLHTWVCATRSPTRLAQAQRAIRTDWTTVERIIR